MPCEEEEAEGKGQWITNAALYIIMVGRPGLGKTPPLEAAFRPIRRNDNAKMVKGGTAMRSDQDAIRAEYLNARQQHTELSSAKDCFLRMLEAFGRNL